MHPCSLCCTEKEEVNTKKRIIGIYLRLIMTLGDINEVINFLKENLIVVIARAMAQVGFH